MNKNLKKVISAVAALAMSASTFVAFAANYPDVDASASYKQAVDELSALSVIEGYEDGTFQPDKLVTRAEFSKMVITALGSSELAQAEAAAGRDTQFTDVTGSHWAAGYVTAATTFGIINGMGDGTFAPDSNVTYAQAMKMLVCAAGYEQWSVDKGGWPDGYMYWGNQIKVGNGVKDVNDNTEITRAQVAQMIDNVLNAPLCEDTHEYDYDAYGNKYAKLEQMDGTGRDFESLLIKNHDIYKVKGVVTQTKRSQTGSGLKVDEVNFEVQNADRWLDETEPARKDNTYPIKAKVGESGVENYVRQYVQVLVREDDDDEYTILSVASAGQTETVSFLADDYDDDKTTTAEERIYFYSNSRSSSYKIDDETALYVNGVEIVDGGGISALYADLGTYVAGNTASDVTLLDIPDGGSTDGYYDMIMVNYYDTAIVDTVDKIDSTKPVINFKEYSTGAKGKIEIDTTDDDKSYSFVNTEGTVVELSEINENDVLSIQRDVSASSSFDQSDFYDVIVCSATDEGKYTTYDDEDKEYEINGTTYSVVKGLDANKTPMVSDLDGTITYTIYLDAFGRIAYVDELASAKKVAILDKVYLTRGTDYTVTLILKDGTSEDFDLREITGTNQQDIAANIIYGAKATTFNQISASGLTTDDKQAPQERVIEYSLNSSNELTIKNDGKALKYADSINKEYRASSDRIGSYKVSADVTSFINASEPDDITAMSYSSLVDGKEYTAYLFDKSSSDSTYRLVLITSGSGEYSTDTQLAVYKKMVSTQNDDDETVTAYVMLVNGEEQQVVLDDACTGDTSLTAGDAVIYATNNSGDITDITKVASLGFDGASTKNTYANVRNAAMTDTSTVIGTDGILAKDENTGYITALSKEDDVNIIFGAVTDKTSSSVSLSPIKDGVSQVSEEEEYSFDADVKIYAYNSDESKVSNALSVETSSSAMTRANVPTNNYLRDVVDGVTLATTSKTAFDWNYTYNANRDLAGDSVINASFAIIRTVDDNVMEIYVINPND